MKEFKLLMSEYEDEYGDNCKQKVWSENEDEKVRFRAYDLCECPEDAIIGRELFSASDFIQAINLGFRIAKRGYDKITVERVPWG